MSTQSEELPVRTALYRTYDVGDALLYVGISNNFGTRWKRHAAAKPWWLEVQRLTVQWYPNREEAEVAEIAAIKAEKPKYNIHHNMQRPPRLRLPAPVPPPVEDLDISDADYWHAVNDSERFRSILNLPSDLNGMLRCMCIQAIADSAGGESDPKHLLPAGRKEFLDLASRAGVERAYRYKLYQTWASAA